MNLIFTLCSNNYLAQAKTLMDSLGKFEPKAKLVIGLVDKLSDQIDYTFFHPVEIIPISEVGINSLEEMCRERSVVELNTSVKPSFIRFLIRKFDTFDNIFYFDPDIKVFDSISLLFEELKRFDILITPHIVTPILIDGYRPQENIFLKYGLYNMGFLGLSTKGENVEKFLSWWEERVLNFGFWRPEEGYFVDQLWVNLVPIFFDRVKILKEYRFNMAPWNLHERCIVSEKNGAFMLNDSSLLCFYHFSFYDFKNPEMIVKKNYNRFNFNNRPDLARLYGGYHQELLKNRIEYFSSFKCALLIEKTVNQSKTTRESLPKIILRNILPPFIYKMKH
jgi:hypothetical protein